MFPCDELTIVVALKYFKLKHRSESPCRIDYPTKLKKLLKEPLDPSDLQNSIFAPNLPYDQNTCNLLCTVDYWLPKCNCMMNENVWRYAGKPKSIAKCPYAAVDIKYLDYNCTIDNIMERTPPAAFAKCECWTSCEGYTFEVNGYEKIHHSFGRFFHVLYQSQFEPVMLHHVKCFSENSVIILF